MATWLQKIEEARETDFLESFPTYRLHSTPRSGDGRWVFSSKDESYENDSCSSDDVGTRMMIYDKIKSAFTQMMLSIIAQFWAPVTIGGKHYLSTSGQPFAVRLLCKDFIKYRRMCVEHVYDIDVNSKFRGTPASAFLNRFPEIASMDPSFDHEVDPFFRNASQECGLNYSIMIPICCPSQTSSSSDCIGVIEGSSWLIDDVKLFNEINMKIKEVGLGVYNVQDRIPYKVTMLPEALKEGKKQVAVDYIAPLGTKCKPAPVLTPQQVIEQQSGISTTEKFLGTEVGQNSISGGEFGLLVNSNDENGGSSQHKNVQENGNGIIHRSLQSQPLAEKMLKALSLLPLELSRSGSEQKYMEETSIPADQISGNATDSTDIMLGACPPDQRLSEFLETFPTYILHKKPETEGAFWIFCRKDKGSHNNSSLGDLGTRMIHDKIKSAFSKVSNGGELIVQFWAPITSGNRLVLSTSGQPFAISVFGEGLEEYRGRCVGYECNIDMNNDNNKFIKDDIEQHQDRHPMTMISGPPTTAFLNRLPEAVLDTKNHREGSLMRYASNCGLWTSYTLPIGCPSQYHSSCIGVVECSSLSSVNLEIVNTMKRALEQEGLNVFNVQDRIPYNTIHGLTLVRDEIQVALKSVCELHKIGVAQVWISYEDEIRVPFSFSSVDTQTTRRLALKLTGYNSGDEDSTTYHWRFKEYYDACDMVPLKMGEELVGKTLHDYQPRFCENISELGTDTLMGWVSTDDAACSGFTICMSIDTGDFNCAFEFIWHHTPNYVPLLEALLLTLKRRLPRFNFASGAELGDQLHVIDVDNSTESEAEFFKIFKEKGLSPIPEAIDKGKKAMVVNYNARSKEKHDTTEINLSREDIEQHYGKTMKKAAEDLGVSLSTLKRKHNKLGMSGWQGPDLPQRKTYNSNKNQRKESHTHEKDNGVIQDPSPVKRNENTVIKAEYEDDIIKIRLGNSEATFVTVENEIGKKFKMKNGTFKIKYLDEDEEWILMTSDQDLSDCIQNSRRMRVLLHNQ